ncbi:hypothetical protein PHLCEN_2v7344 [Hermanssonia centrifuga]|uniref:Cupin type-1 domain-containing protein n=1 Tax=Hermanssonia centrifuga TaxID=98765 RepID=A0A2R6NXD9_9APHY|nr:hypothetical protein PHLCEN_2v7344 [Hermanssonia centrifuga]
MSGLKLNIAIVCAVLLATHSSAAPAVSSALVASSAIPSASFFPAPASSVAVSASNPALSPSSAPLSSSLVPASSAAASVDSSSAKASSIASAAPASETVPYASDDPNEVMWGPDYDGDPQPIRGALGSTVMGPQDAAIDIQNPDLFAPPTTDAGTVGNAKWPFSLSHNRLQTGGWARQQNVAVLPMATELAGVDMRLEAGAIRELHWHKTSEDAGDLWFFPAGTPHSLQATDADPDGAEFLLVFDDGSFSEDSTFLLTDWLAHVPKEVLARNFQTDISAFNDIPGQQLYIFPGSAPGPDSDVPTSPQGSVPSPFTFKMSQMKATQLSGGSVKVVDSRTFPISTTTAAAEVTVQPGAMRELHWHPTQDEWSFFLEGNARVTLFAAQGAARTYNFQAGDVGYVPGTYGHYVENIGNTTLRFLEIFKTDTFQDVSLSQWLALTPPAMVQATLNLNDEAMSHLSKIKQTVVGPASGSSK